MAVLGDLVTGICQPGMGAAGGGLPLVSVPQLTVEAAEEFLPPLTDLLGDLALAHPQEGAQHVITGGLPYEPADF
jgi:hypothetical protein